jgi:signal transduction histidine kinase
MVQFQTAFQDRDGTMWVSRGNQVYTRSAGEARFVRRPIKSVLISQFLQDSAGRIWAVDMGDSVHPIFSPLPDDPLLGSQVRVGSAMSMFDTDGELWVTSIGDGLRRVSDPEKPFGRIAEFGTEVAIFTKENGLSSNFISSIFQDEEGAIWVGTRYGLDCFRKGRVVSRPDPKAAIVRFNMQPGDQGDAWFAGGATLGHLWVTQKQIASQEVTLANDLGILPPVPIQSTFHSSAPALCHTNQFGVLCSDGDLAVITPFPAGIPQGYFRSRAWLDPARTLWLATEDYGLFYRAGKDWKSVPTNSGKSAWESTAEMAARDGSEWLAFGEQIIRFKSGQQEVLSFAENLNLGAIHSITEHGDHIWVGGSTGLGFYDHHRAAAIRTQGIGGLTAISGVQETRNGDLWVSTRHGLIHLNQVEIAHALRDEQYGPTFDLFGAQDGLAGPGVNAEQLASNGILFLLCTEGFGYIDTNQSAGANSPPRLELRSIEADGQDVPSVNHVELRPGTSNIKLRFVGIDFADPEHVTYKYKLSGVDQDWQYAGSEPQAAYTNLAPGRYNFHVITRRASGSWSGDRELVSLYLAPAWYQRLVTRIAAALFLLTAIILYFRYRLKLAEAAILSACDARMAERLRLSADIHDTFLQTVQGSKLIVEDALARTSKDSSSYGDFARISQYLNRAVDEGRQALRALRLNQSVASDLKETLSEVVAEECESKNLLANVEVAGRPRSLHPVVQDEILHISKEAIRNACNHSNGRRVSVVLTYDKDFSIAVSDDGTGIPSPIVEAGKDGHFGLDSMRQRAFRIGGRLRISSEAGIGTTVLAEVPGRVAYIKRRRRAIQSVSGV